MKYTITSDELQHVVRTAPAVKTAVETLNTIFQCVDTGQERSENIRSFIKDSPDNRPIIGGKTVSVDETMSALFEAFKVAFEQDARKAAEAALLVSRNLCRQSWGEEMAQQWEKGQLKKDNAITAALGPARWIGSGDELVRTVG